MNYLTVIPDGSDGNVLPVEMRQLGYYDNLLNQIVTVGRMNGPSYMQDFLKAKDTAALFHSQAVRNYEKCKDMAKKLWGRAKLDKSFNALKEQGIVKPTEGDRESFADQDDDYLMMREAEGYWRSLSFLLQTKVETYQAAHDDVKKIYSGQTEPTGTMTGAASTRESYT